MSSQANVRAVGVVFVLVGAGLNAFLPYSGTKVIAALAGLLIGLGIHYIWPIPDSNTREEAGDG